MKRYIITLVLIVFSVFFHSVLSFAQIIPGLNYLKIIGHGNGKNITFQDPLSGQMITKYAGQLRGYVNPGIFSPPSVSLYYSFNVYEDPVFQDTTYIDTDINVDPVIANIIILYDVILGLPDDSSTAASEQAMIWRQTNNLNIGSITDSVVKARALYALDFLSFGSWTDCFPEQALKLRSIGIDKVRVEVYLPQCIMYGPIPQIHLRISEGHLSDTVISIDGSGVSPLVTVSGVSNGAIISAFAPFLPPAPGSLAGRFIAISEIFRSPHGGAVILVSFTQGFPSHKIDWGTLPVELISFTSIININNVTLNWTTATEINNSEFQVERKSTGNWETIGYVAGHGTSIISHNYEYIDKDVQSGTYTYRLMQVDYNGNFEYHNLTNEVVIGIPNQYTLKQNYPNPFNPTTTIGYSLPLDSRVNLIVYDVTGKEIISLVTNEQKAAGYYATTFNASNLSSGIYYYRLIAGDYKETKKMMLIK